MNSFSTREDSLAALERYPELGGRPAARLRPGQGAEAARRRPRAGRVARRPEARVGPAGPRRPLHRRSSARGCSTSCSSAATSTRSSSNSDNLGAVLDQRILAWFAREGLPFLMEAADRTESDRKGGHLARRRGGGLVLREIAQTPDEDLDAFQDVSRHRYFNTNTIWVNLRALADAVEERDGVLGLPMIVNRKTVDPTDSSSPEVIQLETAMGAAIDVFEGAAAVRVPRTPLRAGQDHQRPARAALGRLRADARTRGGAGAGARRAAAGHRPRLGRTTSCCRDFESRFPGGAAVAGRLRAAGGGGRRPVRPRRGGAGRGAASRARATVEDGAVLEG